jgi:hypothetical protein
MGTAAAAGIESRDCDARVPIELRDLSCYENQETKAMQEIVCADRFEAPVAMCAIRSVAAVDHTAADRLFRAHSPSVPILPRLSRQTISPSSTVLPSYGEVTSLRSSVNESNG